MKSTIRRLIPASLKVALVFPQWLPLCAAFLLVNNATAAQLYWADINGSNIKRADLGSSQVQQLVNDQHLAYMVGSSELGKLFYTKYDPSPGIFSASLNGGNRTQLLSLGPADIPRGIDVDVASGKVYWVSSHSTAGGNGKVRSMNLDGSGLTDLVTLTEDSPYGLAIDHALGKMYWANTAEDSIERANLDGTGRETVLVTDVAYTSPVAVDSVSHRIFWFDSQERLLSADASGDDLFTVATGANSGLDNAITVDEVARRVLWTDNASDVVYSANLDGTNRTAVLNLAGIPSPSISSLSVVPEPSTLVMLLAAVPLGYLAYRHSC